MEYLTNSNTQRVMEMGNPNTQNQTHEPAQRLRDKLKKFAPLALGLGAFVFIGAIAYAAASVYDLFFFYVYPGVETAPLQAGLAVVSSVGVSVALLTLVLTTDNHNTRGMGAILLLPWLLAATLPLVTLDAVLRSNLVTAPDFLKTFGRVVAAALPALALGASVCMAVAMHDETEYKSASAAAAKYVGFVAKVVGVLASAFASFYFGYNKGIDPTLAVLCGFILESCFVWSYLSLIKARQRRDVFDVNMWRAATLAFGAFITAVSIETLSTLAKIDTPVAHLLGGVGATLYVSAVGLSLALTVIVHLLTRAVDAIGEQPQQEPPQITVKPRPTLAGWLGSKAGEFEAARTLRTTPDAQALPAPAATATLASDAPTALDQVAPRQPNSAQEVTGQFEVAANDATLNKRRSRKPAEAGRGVPQPSKSVSTTNAGKDADPGR